MTTFKLNYRKGIIFCRAKIINKNTSLILKMALDTGATYTMISNKAALGIGLDLSKTKRTIEVTTGSGIILAPIVIIPKFQAFGSEIKNLEAICHDLPPESAVEGLIGLNFLKYFNISLNFLKNSMEIKI